MTIKLPPTKKEQMKKLGYKFRKLQSDYIRRDVNGRFHAKSGKLGMFIHYDLFGCNGEHISNLRLPYLFNGEKERIQKIIKTNAKII